MEKVKEYKFLIILAVLILGFGFYWFEIRPVQIRKECFKEQVNIVSAGMGLDSGELYYRSCLKKHGL